MAKQKKLEPPGDDIPVWFMTYSDVITLLMTFFILLLTFSTTEPERFEKVQSSIHNSGGATGIAGKPVDGLEKDSWVTRVRPPAARIAMRGAEMPPLTRAPAKKTFGKGLDALFPDEKTHNESTSHFFDVPINKLFDSNGTMTSQCKVICSMMAAQLADLPFHGSIQSANEKHIDQMAEMVEFMIDLKTSRPGQLEMGFTKPGDLANDRIRFMVSRFEGNKQ